MYFEKKKRTLDVTDLVALSNRPQAVSGGFPSKRFVCRCSNCQFSAGGKCSLKECCCMDERILAHTCSFAEVTRHCFVGIGDAAFRYRLRFAIERAAQLHSCFLSAGHRKRFREGMSLVRKTEYSLIAQLYLLSAHEALWQEARKVLEADGVVYSAMADAVSEQDADAFELYLAASVWEYGAVSADYADLTDEDVVSFDVFRVICHAVPIGLYGTDAIKISERRLAKQKNRKRKEGKDRE